MWVRSDYAQCESLILPTRRATIDYARPALDLRHKLRHISRRVYSLTHDHLVRVLDIGSSVTDPECPNAGYFCEKE